MTTTPATTDHDALKALEQAATTPAPWEVTKLHATDTKFVITDGKAGHAVGTVWSLADAELIAAARNALPALLDELATLRTAHAALLHDRDEWESDNCELAEERNKANAAADKAEQERDAAREELAKTRAELDRVVRERDSLARRCAIRFEETQTAIRERDAARNGEPDGWPKSQDCSIGVHRPCDRDYCRCACHVEANPATTAEPAVCLGKPLCSRGCCGPEVTTAEPADEPDFAECDGTDHPGMTCDQYDTALEPTPPGRLVLAPLDGEPADEPKATCHLPVQNGEPCGLVTCRKHGCRVALHAEPARTYLDMPVVNCGTDVSHMAHVYPVNGVKVVCRGLLPHSVPLDAAEPAAS